MRVHKAGAAPLTHHTTLLLLQWRELQEQHIHAQLVECQLRAQVCLLQAENAELRADLAQAAASPPAVPEHEVCMRAMHVACVVCVCVRMCMCVGQAWHD
jgi:hypothetical protein